MSPVACRVPGCKREVTSTLPRVVFCGHHGSWWWASPERERSVLYNNPDSMLFDFILRISTDEGRQPGLANAVNTQSPST